MGIENFLAFAITALLFIMAPGMDTVFVLNRSITQGKNSGAYAALGVNAGVIVHTLFAALGLSILVTQSPYAYTAIKYIGALYIIYLGMVQVRKKPKKVNEESLLIDKTSRKSNFITGFFTNALNPKVALFFLAFFPQFINPTQVQNPVPFLILGLSYSLIGIAWYLCLNYFAGRFTQKLNGNPKVGIYIDKISGIIFIVMGIGIAVF